MRVRGGHQNVVGGNPGMFLDCPLGGIKNLARNHATIHHDDHEPGLTVVEYETTGVQFVVDMARFHILHIAVDGEPKGRRDVARCGAGAKCFGWSICCGRIVLGDGGQAERKQGKCA